MMCGCWRLKAGQLKALKERDKGEAVVDSYVLRLVNLT